MQEKGSNRRTKNPVLRNGTAVQKSYDSRYEKENFRAIQQMMCKGHLFCRHTTKMAAVSRFFDGLQRFFVIVSLWRFCRSAGTILYIFRCMPANWLRTIFPALLIKNADLLIRFSRPIFRMGPTPAMQPVCWPVPATCEAVPPGPPNPMWREPIPLVLPGDEPNADQDWHRRRSQTSGR